MHSNNRYISILIFDPCAYPWRSPHYTLWGNKNEGYFRRIWGFPRWKYPPIELSERSVCDSLWIVVDAEILWVEEFLLFGILWKGKLSVSFQHEKLFINYFVWTQLSWVLIYSLSYHFDKDTSEKNNFIWYFIINSLTNWIIEYMFLIVQIENYERTIVHLIKSREGELIYEKFVRCPTCLTYHIVSNEVQISN